MSKPRWRSNEDRAKIAARRKKRRANEEAAGLPVQPRGKRPHPQLEHASNPYGTRKRREGTKAMDRERGIDQ